MQKLTDFCSDSDLVELLELAKSSNDIFELLTPRENQHSDLLAWCFNAKEGHGQGDAILKDLLVAVFQAATGDEPGDKLSGRGLSRDFVRAWPPARIMTSSFATAISYREYALPKSESNNKNGIADNRVDLLVVDPGNRLLIIIENKAGAQFRPGQLQGYLEGVQTKLRHRPVFKDFQIVFIAMDRNFDPDIDQDNDDNFDSRWVRLNYEWLRPAGKRAEVALQRGNQSAAVLLSYCRRQTGWESDDMKAMTRLARDLAIRFPAVIKDLSRISRDLLQPEAWTPQLLEPDSGDGQILKLYLQNEKAIRWLIDLSPLQLLHARVAEHTPEVDTVDDGYEYGRVWVDYQIPTNRSMPKLDSRWPLYLAVKHLNPESEDAPEFRIQLVWRPYCVPQEERERVCKLLSEIYPTAKGTSGRKQSVYLLPNISASNFDSAEATVTGVIKKINGVFRSDF